MRAGWPLAAAILVVGVAAACGASANGNANDGAQTAKQPLRETPARANAQRLRTTIYFLTDDGTAPLGVRRTLTRERSTPLARRALEVLLAGPSPAERRAGLTSALPARAKIRSFRIVRHPTGSDAFVDLSGLPPAQTTDAVTKVRVFTQVARTLIGLSDVARVWIRSDGKPWGLWNMRGQILDVPHDYRELRGFFRVCVSRPGSETIPATCFSALP
jgi:spore germination protein GerM